MNIVDADEPSMEIRERQSCIEIVVKQITREIVWHILIAGMRNTHRTRRSGEVGRFLETGILGQNLSSERRRLQNRDRFRELWQRRSAHSQQCQRVAWPWTWKVLQEIWFHCVKLKKSKFTARLTKSDFVSYLDSVEIRDPSRN